MGFYNRRNAAIGWVTWLALKRVLRQTAKSAVPSVDTASKKPNKSAIALASVAATAVGVLTFWKHRSGGDDTRPDDSA